MSQRKTTRDVHSQSVPIIVYHHVYPQDSPELKRTTFETGSGIIAQDEFRRHMRYIVDKGWTTVPTARIVNWLEHNNELPQKALAIHFDNGWLDTLTVALPIMQELGLKGMCFPITDGVEAASEGKPAVTVRTKTEGIINKPFLTWDNINQLLAAGWEIGAHSATHCQMAEAHAVEGDKAILREVETSSESFSKHLGFVPEHFAYPSGSRNNRTDELLMKYYQSLRLWHFEYPISWKFTDRNTPISAIEVQNVDLRVTFEDFKRIMNEAMPE